jgi:hypothetical protein
MSARPRVPPKLMVDAALHAVDGACAKPPEALFPRPGRRGYWGAAAEAALLAKKIR